MRLLLLPYSFSEGFSPILDPMFEAFYTAPETRGYAECLWGKDSPAAKQRAEALINHDLTTDSSTRWMVVRDADAGNRIVSIAEWSIITTCTPGNLEPWKPDIDYFDTKEECQAASEAMFTMTSNVVNAIKKFGGPNGEPHVRLKILCTHPDYQQKGAGAAQVRWGCELADFLRLPAWVEASPNGNRVYTQGGFVQVERTGCKTSVWEIDGNLMRRPAKDTSPLPVQPRS